MYYAILAHHLRNERRVFGSFQAYQDFCNRLCDVLRAYSPEFNRAKFLSEAHADHDLRTSFADGW